MSSSSMKPLTDDEAGKEMRKMVAFIMQEAAEKSREIQVKADEEFNIEKAKLVRQETANIEQQYSRKLKQAEVKRRIAQSIQVNKARLQVLQARDQVLDEVLENSKNVLRETSKNATSYQALLNGLVLQSLYRLMDDKVTITCRAKDVPMVEKAIRLSIDEFSKQAGKTVKVSIDSNHLPEDSAGGVIASSLNGRIKSDNTLETRLQHAFEQLLPKLRIELVGHSQNRKFFD